MKSLVVDVETPVAAVEVVEFLAPLGILPKHPQEVSERIPSPHEEDLQKLRYRVGRLLVMENPRSL